MNQRTTSVTVLCRSIEAHIQRLCAKGDMDADRGRYADALASYWAAWDLLPEPQVDYQAATWILAAVGDANFLGGNFTAGCDNLSTAMNCPGGIDIAYLHLRLGQCQFELGLLVQARKELGRAWHGEGAALFDEEDPKYLRFMMKAN